MGKKAMRGWLKEHAATSEGGVALAWAGGPAYHLRSEAAGISTELFLVRTNADGLVDRAYANNGVRRIDWGIGFVGLSLAWIGTRLTVASLYPTAEEARITCAIVDAAAKVRDLNFKYLAEGKGATVTARFGSDGITGATALRCARG